MPVDFLTADQERSYGRYAGELSRAQLGQYFHLDDRDRGVIDQLREDHTRLGYAAQLATVRFLGTFLVDPRDVHPAAVAYLAGQLDIADPTCLARYLDRPATHHEHTADIRRRFGYRDFSEQPEHFRLVRWLHARAWLSNERPSILFDLATARLVDARCCCLVSPHWSDWSPVSATGPSSVSGRGSQRRRMTTSGPDSTSCLSCRPESA